MPVFACVCGHGCQRLPREHQGGSTTSSSQALGGAIGISSDLSDDWQCVHCCRFEFFLPQTTSLLRECIPKRGLTDSGWVSDFTTCCANILGPSGVQETKVHHQHLLPSGQGDSRYDNRTIRQWASKSVEGMNNGTHGIHASNSGGFIGLYLSSRMRGIREPRSGQVLNTRPWSAVTDGTLDVSVLDDARLSSNLKGFAEVGRVTDELVNKPLPLWALVRGSCSNVGNQLVLAC